MEWQFNGVTITVTDLGSFEATVEGDHLRADTLAGVKAKIEDAQKALSTTKRANLARPVFVATGEYVGLATFRGISAKDGRAMITTPDGQKLTVPSPIFPVEPDLNGRLKANREEAQRLKTLVQRNTGQWYNLTKAGVDWPGYVSGHLAAAQYTATVVEKLEDLERKP